MMNRRRLIKIGIVLSIVVIAITVPLLIGLTKINNLDLQIQYPQNSIILDKTDIEKDLLMKYGDFTNYKRNKIKTKDIKTYLESRDFVEHAIVSISLTGVLRITINQKHIIARVYNNQNQQYYIDKNMEIIRINSNTKNIARTLIVTGDIKDYPSVKIDSVKNKTIYMIHKLANSIDKDKVLKKWISGIYKNKDFWFLIPSQGDYIITLGEPLKWNEELEKLKYLLTYSFEKNGWDNYSDIDLRFHNQVICNKKENVNNKI